MSSSYGDGCAEFYDELYGPPNPTIVRTLSRLASRGAVLELGLATGRTALALTPHCAEVVGIESSRAMLERFASKDGAHQVRAIEADFATICLADRFDLIFVLTNTLFLLDTKELMLECLRNVRLMLKKHGVFLVEAYRPHDYITQSECEARMTTYSHTVKTKFGERVYQARILYREVAELDFLASSVGLELKERWADWNGLPYMAGAHQHISVYRRAPDTPLIALKRRK